LPTRSTRAHWSSRRCKGVKSSSANSRRLTPQPSKLARIARPKGRGGGAFYKSLRLAEHCPVDPCIHVVPMYFDGNRGCPKFLWSDALRQADSRHRLAAMRVRARQWHSTSCLAGAAQPSGMSGGEGGIRTISSPLDSVSY
jgi:hypothetical protein